MKSRDLLAVLLVCAVLQGCATPGPGVFQFDSPTADGKPVELTWPSKADGEVPRYMFLGTITGEGNFKKPDSGSGAQGFLRWLAELIKGEAPPVVLQRPQAGVVDENGRILITDSSRQAVFVFDLTQGRMDLWERAGAFHFASPTGIALGPEGEVFVADANLGFVARLDRKGELLGTIGKGILKRPIGLAFDSMQNHLYVADTYAHDIKIFDAQGNLLNTLGQRGDKAGEFNFPTYLSLHGGELYVVDTMSARVQVVDVVSGETKRIIGSRSLNVGGFVRPKGIAVDSESNIYVVESYYDHLLIYNKRGDFLLPIGGSGQAPGQFFLPSGVWIDAKDRVYVADMFNGRVTVFQFLGGGADNE